MFSVTLKKHVIKYCEKVNERSGKNLFWSIKISCEVLNKLKSLGFCASSLSYCGLTGGFLLLRNFSVAISVSPHVCFILVLILISMFLK